MMRPIHILLVEDNEGDILLTTEALKDGKMVDSIDVVKDGWEAIQYLEKKDKYIDVQTPDLILLDLNLPKMNGYEVLSYIKSNDRIKHIPVVTLTTSSAEKDIFESYQHHANCFITKPLEANSFMNVISSIKDFWTSVVRIPTKH